MKITDILGKICESTTGKKGYVIGVTESDKKLDCLICADGNEREFIVDMKDVIRVRDSVLFAGSAQREKSGAPVRLGKPVFDGDGAYLGRLTDFTVKKGVITFAHAGRKKFPAENIVCGDAVIVKYGSGVLKSDVKKDGRVIIRRGTPVTRDVLDRAQKEGEYVQTKLKSL